MKMRNEIDYSLEMKHADLKQTSNDRTLKRMVKLIKWINIVVKGGNIQGDTINQMSETNITGELEVNNTETTQKIIQEHF